MISFKVPSEMYGITDCVITDIDRTIKTGFAPCGSGEDYKFTSDETAQLKRIHAGEKIDFVREVFQRKQIEQILREHNLFMLKEKIKRMFIIGSFAKGTANGYSDIDILLEIGSKKIDAKKVTDKYRRKIQTYFVANGLVKDDSVHPNFKGRRLDVYFTYDADANKECKIEII